MFFELKLKFTKTSLKLDLSFLLSLPYFDAYDDIQNMLIYELSRLVKSAFKSDESFARYGPKSEK